MLITYKLHIKPTKEQENIMFDILNNSRHLYNHLLNKKIFLYNNYKYSINKTELEKYSKFLATTDEYTSQTCLCGASVPKTLKDRVHNCSACGTIEDRDIHSAKIILSRSKIKLSK